MRLLADENIPGPAVAALRREGHEVVWMSEEAPGTPDMDVLERAVRGDYLLLTFDKDFGTQVQGGREPAAKGAGEAHARRDPHPQAH